jgi:uncharacterized glyoxalase superfamily protein PhnB
MFVALTPNLYVKDVKKSVEFWKSIFSAELLTHVPGDNDTYVWAMLKIGGVGLMLQSLATVVEEGIDYNNIETGGTQSFYLDCENALELYELIKDKVNILSPPEETFYNTTEFNFTDIDGYMFTVASDNPSQEEKE